MKKMRAGLKNRVAPSLVPTPRDLSLVWGRQPHDLNPESFRGFSAIGASSGPTRTHQILFLVLSLAASPLIPARAQAPAPPAAGSAPTAPPAASVPTDLSPAVTDVVRLAESGVGDDVVLAFVQNSTATFHLSADDILYLRDIGLSPAVTAEMINHDSTLRSQTPAQAPTYATAPPPQTVPAPEPATAPPPVEAAAPTYVGSPPPEVGYFYNGLSPYGTWVDLDGVGWCWQPSVVVIQRAWRPYCDGGHWIYSDAGWCWQSDYSWGWAPFHYGRWHLHSRCGWVWVPDTVWAPAWVTWRVAGSTCGWAPLPPHSYFDVGFGWRYNGVAVGLSFDFGLAPSCFTFVAVKDCISHDLVHHCLPPAQVTTIYKQTTIINNYTVNNKIIVNRGVPVDRVASAAHTEIHRAEIRDLPAGAARPAVQSAGERGSPVVYRHPLPPQARTTTIVAQKVDDRHPVVQHTPLLAVRAERSTPSSGSSSVPYHGGVPSPSARESGTGHREATPPRGGTQPPTGGAPGTPHPSGRETPPGSAPSYPSPKGYSTTPAYTPPPGHPDNAQTPAHSTPAYPPTPGPSSSQTHTPEGNATAHTTPAYTPPPPNPAHSSAESPTRTPEPASGAVNPHFYSPRTTHGAEQLHSHPSPEARPPAPSPPPSHSEKDQGSQGSQGSSKKQQQ